MSVLQISRAKQQPVGCSNGWGWGWGGLWLLTDLQQAGDAVEESLASESSVCRPYDQQLIMCSTHDKLCEVGARHADVENDRELILVSICNNRSHSSQVTFRKPKELILYHCRRLTTNSNDHNKQRSSISQNKLYQSRKEALSRSGMGPFQKRRQN